MLKGRSILIKQNGVFGRMGGCLCVCVRERERGRRLRCRRETNRYSVCVVGCFVVTVAFSW